MSKEHEIISVSTVHTVDSGRRNGCHYCTVCTVQPHTQNYAGLYIRGRTGCNAPRIEFITVEQVANDGIGIIWFVSDVGENQN